MSDKKILLLLSLPLFLIIGMGLIKSTINHRQIATKKASGNKLLQELDVSLDKFEQWKKGLSRKENQTFVSLVELIRKPDFSEEKLSVEDKAFIAKAVQEATVLGVFDKARQLNESPDIDPVTRDIVWELFTLRRTIGAEPSN